MGNCGCGGSKSTSLTENKDFVYLDQKPIYQGCTKKHEYFDKYNSLEKQIVAENLGLNCKNINIQNYPDEEDLTQENSGNELVLKFKNKKYEL